MRLASVRTRPEQLDWGTESKGSMMQDRDREEMRTSGTAMTAGSQAGMAAGAAIGGAASGIIGWGVGVVWGMFIGFVAGIFIGL